MVPRENHLILVRFFAAFMILLSHSRMLVDGAPTYEWIAAKVTLVFPGVPILFFVSGFLVSLSYRSSTSVYEFVAKRILRIYPPLWASLVVTIVVLLGFGIVDLSEFGVWHFLGWVATQATIFPQYHPAELRDFGVGVVNGSLWVIPVILQFYLILPLLSRIDANLSQKFGSNWIWWLLGFAAVVNVAFNLAFNNFPDSIPLKVLFVSLVPWLFVFLVGYVVQRDFESFRRLYQGRFWFWLGLQIALYTLFWELGMRWGRNDINPFSLLILVQIILAAAFAKPFVSANLKRIENWMQDNDFTFGIFVYHMLIMNLFIEFLPIESWYLQIMAFVAVTLLVAYISMKTLERPVKIYRDRIIEGFGRRLGIY